MKASFIASLVAAAALIPTLASAQPAAEVTQSSTVFVGGNLQLLPTGSLKASANGRDTSADTATAFAIGALAEARLSPYLSIGFAPRYIFNIKDTSPNSTDSATQLDLAVRVTAGSEVAPKVRLYGYAAPGYSFMFLPSSAGSQISNPSGFIVGFGGGASYEVAPKIALTGELGYQLGFQSTTVQGTSVDLKDNYLQIGVGLSAALN